MKFTEHFAHKENIADWCHVCGKRETTPKADIRYPKNAEHDTKDVNYLRICKSCLNTALDVLQPAIV